MWHQQSPEANLEANLILNALYINYFHFLSSWNHSSQYKSKIYNQISIAQWKPGYLSNSVNTWTVKLFELFKKKKPPCVQMIGYKYKLWDFFCWRQKLESLLVGLCHLIKANKFLCWQHGENSNMILK